MKARDSLGWLADAAAPLHEAIAIAWALARGEAAVPRRGLDAGLLEGVAEHVPAMKPAGSAGMEAGRKAILDTIAQACAAPLSEALVIQSELSSRFMGSPACRNGRIGAAYAKAMTV